MRIPNPNDGQPFQRIVKDDEGQPLYGIRHEHTRDEEIVHIPTGQSNQAYYTPEKVLDPELCPHEFTLTHMGKREVECSRCGIGTAFVVGVNYKEDVGAPYFLFNKTWYPITTPA